jgi:hypothetical protein
MNRRELLALGIAIPFTTVTYNPVKADLPSRLGPKDTTAEGRYGPRDSEDAVWDAWLDDYDKDTHHLDKNEIVR